MSAPLLPVTLLTGFLGSGKTTTLNRLLRHPSAAGTAVVVNELGEIGLDQVLIERSSAGAVLLGNGCVCCTVRGDLGTTLQDLLVQQAQGEIPAFVRVVLETTGLADPAPILHLLMTDPVIASRYRLGGVVATVDAVNGASTLERHAEAVKQAAVADRILVTKTDLADVETVREIESRLAGINAGAKRIIGSDDALDPAEVFDIGLYNPRTKSLDVQRWLAAEAYAACGHGPACDDSAHHHHDHRHDHGIESFAVAFDEPIAWEAFSRWLEALTLKRGEDLLRMKGIVNIAESPGRPLVVHGVQRIFHPPVSLDAWPSDDHRTRIVFITRNIERKAIEETLRLFMTTRGEKA